MASFEKGFFGWVPPLRDVHPHSLLRTVEGILDVLGGPVLAVHFLERMNSGYPVLVEDTNLGSFPLLFLGVVGNAAAFLDSGCDDNSIATATFDLVRALLLPTPQLSH